MAVLIIIAALALGIGALEISQATMGVGFGIVACFLAIMARIAQADTQHKKLLAAIKATVTERETPA